MSVREAAERVIRLHPSRRDSLWDTQTQEVADAYLAIAKLITPEVREAVTSVIEPINADNAAKQTDAIFVLKDFALAVIERVGKEPQ